MSWLMTNVAGQQRNGLVILGWTLCTVVTVEELGPLGMWCKCPTNLDKGLHSSGLWKALCWALVTWSRLIYVATWHQCRDENGMHPNCNRITILANFFPSIFEFSGIKQKRDGNGKGWMQEVSIKLDTDTTYNGHNEAARKIKKWGGKC